MGVCRTEGYEGEAVVTVQVAAASSEVFRWREERLSKIGSVSQKSIESPCYGYFLARPPQYHLYMKTALMRVDQ